MRYYKREKERNREIEKKRKREREKERKREREKERKREKEKEREKERERERESIALSFSLESYNWASSQVSRPGVTSLFLYFKGNQSGSGIKEKLRK